MQTIYKLTFPKRILINPIEYRFDSNPIEYRWGSNPV